tara:strand:- start:2776 stop:2982 length:207 start_codon:yes stop_codon:yes gene_type:complete
MEENYFLINLNPLFLQNFPFFYGGAAGQAKLVYKEYIKRILIFQKYCLAVFNAYVYTTMHSIDTINTV